MHNTFKEGRQFRLYVNHSFTSPYASTHTAELTAGSMDAARGVGSSHTGEEPLVCKILGHPTGGVVIAYLLAQGPGTVALLEGSCNTI